MTPAASDQGTPTAGVLRAAMVDRIVAYRESIPEFDPLPDRVLAAMRTVPRHLFVPDAALRDAYAEDTVVTKRGPAGEVLVCASVPSVVAGMLGLLDVRAGQRVLEVGAGTGYNAALLAEVVGPSGQVTTVDVDADAAAHARRALDDAGYGRVRVTTGDGWLGAADAAPFDRIIVTVGPWDIPPAWWEQVVLGGRIVVPLRWRGQSRAVAFVRHRHTLVAREQELCWFVPLRGAEPFGERSTSLDDDGLVRLTWDRDQAIEPDALSGVLDRPRQEVWSGEWLGNCESMDGISLRLAATESGACRIDAAEGAIAKGWRSADQPSRYPALVDGASIAYLALRREGEARRWELGAVGHGPAGAVLAARVCERIQAWAAARMATPTITAYPAGTSVLQLDAGAAIVDKPSARLVVAY